MKTATVRDLRNHFADVAKWIEHGEAVTITRNGTAFASAGQRTINLLQVAIALEAGAPMLRRWLE